MAIPPPLCCIGLTSPVFERVTSPIRAAADRGILNIETKCSLVWANGWAPRLVHDGFFWRWLPTRYVFHLISLPSSPRNPNKRGIGLSPTVKWSGKQKARHLELGTALPAACLTRSAPTRAIVFECLRSCNENPRKSAKSQ